MASFVIGGDTSGTVTFQAPSVAGSTTLTLPASTGTVITTATTGNALPGQINWNTTPQTSGFTAVAYGGYFCNTTSAAFTVTLPSSPTRGQFVVIVDYAGTAATNNITVSPNGGNINSTSSNAVLATNRQGITFTYIDATQGWLASSNVYGGNPPFAQTYTASYIVVAGGGGGGSGVANYATGGGAGAGGYITGTFAATAGSGTVYTAVVGGGGAIATNGSNSTFTGATSAVGGGKGASFPAAGSSGGSGGGGFGSNVPNSGGAGTPGQGNAGGSSPGAYAGGGGGASAVGGAGTAPSVGGDGTASSITGTSVYYAGGGGGTSTGGLGGGGACPGTNGVAGTANTGGGGGAGSATASIGYTGAAGGSGVVILSVPTSSYSGTTTGSPTVTTSGSNTIITWTTGSGTYTA
jgi:hypothetical protein